MIMKDLWRAARAALAMGLAGALCGCMPSSLLITPVTARRSLVETELSRDSFLAFNKIVVINLNSGRTLNRIKVRAK